MALICDHSSANLLENDELQAFYSDNDGGISSGYDSGDVYDSETEPEVNQISSAHFFHTVHSDSESDDDDSQTDEMESDTDDDCESDFGDDNGDVMRFSSMDNLCDSLRYILSMPELCDVTFLVGQHKVPIYGVKAILGTRSRVMYNMILKKEKEIEESLRLKSKGHRSSKRRSEKPSKLIIDIGTYEPEVFRKIIQFVHSGMVNVDISSVIGLIYGSEEFGLKDLRMACWDFIDRCMETNSNPQQFMTSSCYQMYNSEFINSIFAKIHLRKETKTKSGLTKGVELENRRETTV